MTVAPAFEAQWSLEKTGGLKNTQAISPPSNSIRTVLSAAEPALSERRELERAW